MDAKRDSDSGHISPSLDHEKGQYAQHAEQQNSALEQFPDPDAGKSEEERAAIVRLIYHARVHAKNSLHTLVPTRLTLISLYRTENSSVG